MKLPVIGITVTFSIARTVSPGGAGARQAEAATVKTNNVTIRLNFEVVSVISSPSSFFVRASPPFRRDDRKKRRLARKVVTDPFSDAESVA